MKTVFRTKEAALGQREWSLVDAEGHTLGRLASEVATLLRGKDKPDFTPHVDGGNFVIVINADKIKVSGNKASQKKYYHHTGYIGGIKEISFDSLLKKSPDTVIRKAVKGMLPKGALGHQIINKLKVYAGSEHPHLAQNPVQYQLKFEKIN
jgi:large subunit ribosomal protein L13